MCCERGFHLSKFVRPCLPCRVLEMDVSQGLMTVEYHRSRLSVRVDLVGDLGRFRRSALFQFLGELELGQDGSVGVLRNALQSHVLLRCASNSEFQYSTATNFRT
jgi:hypothetical protein